MTRTKVEGLKQLDRRLGKLGKRVGKSLLRRVLKKAGQPIAEAAQARAPVLTGELRDGIHVGSKLSRSQTKLARAGSRSTVEIYVGPKPSAESITQEFGAAQHPAQPYMRPAWDAEKRHSLEVIKTELGNEIVKVEKRQSQRAAKARR